MKLIVKHDKRFLLVEKPEFINLIKFLNPKAKVFKADALKNYILNSYEEEKYEEKLVLKERLKNNCSKISLSTDIWTSPSQIPFMTITCHYIDANFQLHSEVMYMVHIPGSHTCENIYRAFFNSITEYEIDKNILGVTLDNASNNETFIKVLSGGRDITFSESFPMFRKCFKLGGKGFS